MAKIYAGDVGTKIKVDMGESMVGATALSFEIQKPNQKPVTFTPVTINGNFLEYITVANDIDLVGDWDMNPKLTLGSWSGLGETVSFEVFAKFK